jgi:hypothetical protein
MAPAKTTKSEAQMTPETTWAKAMAFENRPNPYPFFDELRKTPVVHVGNGDLPSPSGEPAARR